MYPQSVSLNIVFNFLLHGLEQGSQVKGTIFLSLFNILMFIHKHVCEREGVCVYVCVYTHILLCHRVCEVRKQLAETRYLLLLRGLGMDVRSLDLEASQK